MDDVDQSGYLDALFGPASVQGHVADPSHPRGNAGAEPAAQYAHAAALHQRSSLHPPPPPPPHVMAGLPLDTSFDFLSGIGVIGHPLPPPSPSAQTAPAYNNNPQLLLQQRLKMNQLQQLQLQNQIIQHQLEMLGSGSGHPQSSSPMDVDARQKPSPGSSQQQQQQQLHYGLPTPLNSTEIQAQPSTEFVSPMALSSYMDSTSFRPADGGSHTPLPPPDMPLHPHLAGAHSAPANLVFNTAPPVALPSPSDLGDFDLSPLTSPWIEAYNNNTNTANANQHDPRPSKRTASPRDDDGSRFVRARPSPALTPVSSATRRGTKSASSTPLMRSTRRGKNAGSNPGAGAGLDVVGDSPSPVDLSMPPPAPPAEFVSPPHDGDANAGALGAVSMTPVTPASMMNLGRLGGLASASGSGTGAESATRGTRRRGSTATARKQGGTPLVSPSLKPILPAGGMSSQTAMGAGAMPVPAVRKTSHKAAEQKRRDSLKTTFDELRGLLPPIPLPSEDGFGDEPVLPGAMPPRGPPRGASDGPNRGISKLQLLRCGNDYIRGLKGQVDRRDSEMERLRREVARLRILVAPEAWKEEGEEEEIDLERDVDDGAPMLWKRSSTQPLDDDGEDDVD